MNNEYAGNLLHRIHEMEEGRDIILVAELDRQTFPVHRVIMSASSEYFKALLGPNFIDGKQDQFVMRGFDGSTLLSIISFCYTGQIELTIDNIESIIEAAASLSLELLEKTCGDFLIKNISLTNCFNAIALADVYSLVELKHHAVEFICTNFELLESSNLNDLSYEVFAELLKCDAICGAEEGILKTLMNFIECAETMQREDAAELLKLIKYHRIDKNFLTSERVSMFFTKFANNSILNDALEHRIVVKPERTSYRYVKKKLIRILYSPSVGQSTSRTVSLEFFNASELKWELLGRFFLRNSPNFGDLIIHRRFLYAFGMDESFRIDLITHEFIEIDPLNSILENFVIAGDDIFLFVRYERQVKIRRFSTLTNSFDKIDVQKGRSVMLTYLSAGRYSLAAAASGTRIFIAGGLAMSNIEQRDVCCYDQATANWHWIPPMRENHDRIVLMADETSIIVTDGNFTSAERYDSSSRAWQTIRIRRIEVDPEEVLSLKVTAAGDAYYGVDTLSGALFSIEWNSSLRLTKILDQPLTSLGTYQLLYKSE